MPPMGGGLIQLLAYGVQDIYLASMPRIDTCISYEEEFNKRKYNNFKLMKTHFYNYANSAFKEKTGNELIKKYNSYNYMQLKSDGLCVIETGNERIVNIIKEHIQLAKDERQKKSLTK